MDKFGLIGDPVAHSESPALFKKAYSEIRQEDGSEYSYDLIEGGDFEASFERFLKEYKAVNVTSPFKEAAFQKVLSLAGEGKGTISGPAARIGAANILVKGPEGISAHNSDFTGLIISIAEAYYPGIVKEFRAEFGGQFFVKVHQFFRQCLNRTFNRKPQALVVGCGGFGRAAAVAAAELGFDTALMNRTPGKAQALADSLPEYGFIVDQMADFKEAVKECDLIIYALPVALPEIKELSADDYAAENSGHGKVILEAGYKEPAFDSTDRLKILSADGTYVSGRQLLFAQALTGWSLMTGANPAL